MVVQILQDKSNDDDSKPQLIKQNVVSRDSIIDAGRKRVKDKFSEQAFGDRLVEVLTDMDDQQTNKTKLE